MPGRGRVARVSRVRNAIGMQREPGGPDHNGRVATAGHRSLQSPNDRKATGHNARRPAGSLRVVPKRDGERGNPINLEKAIGTAKYANHAKAELAMNQPI